MPIRFTDLARSTKGATLDLPGQGEAIHFEFRHGLITPQFMHTFLGLQMVESASVAEQQAAIMAISEQLARIVTEWDVREEDGVTMFPLRVERLARDIPLTVQIGILQTCLAEMAPGESSAPGGNASPPSKPPSGAGSSPTGRSARRRTGIRS